MPRAVAYRLNRNHRSGIHSRTGLVLRLDTGAEAVDEDTVRITTEGPEPAFPSRLYWRKRSARGEPERRLGSNPVGPDPHVDAWDRGTSSTSSPTPDTGATRPRYQEAEFRFNRRVRQPACRAFMSGETDPHQPTFFPIVDSVPNAVAVELAGASESSFSMSMTGDRGRARRQALNLAVDKGSARAVGSSKGYADGARGQLMAPSYFGLQSDYRGLWLRPRTGPRKSLRQPGRGGEIELRGHRRAAGLKDREIIGGRRPPTGKMIGVTPKREGSSGRSSTSTGSSTARPGPMSISWFPTNELLGRRPAAVGLITTSTESGASTPTGKWTENDR